MRYIKLNLNTCLLLKIFFSHVLIILPSSLLSEVFENLQNRRDYFRTYFQVASYFYEEPHIMNKESQLPFLGIGKKVLYLQEKIRFFTSLTFSMVKRTILGQP